MIVCLWGRTILALYAVRMLGWSSMEFFMLTMTMELVSSGGSYA